MAAPSIISLIASRSVLTRQYRVVGHSMGDAMQHGCVIRVIRVRWLLRRLYPFQVGDIVTFIPNERAREAAGVQHRTGTLVFVKRITRVEKGCFFVEGDARHLSCDSNDFGAIGRGSVVGVLPVVLQ